MGIDIAEKRGWQILVRRAGSVALGCVLVVTSLATASAQDRGYDDEGHWTGTSAVRRGPDESWHTQLWTGFEFQGDTDLNGNAGDFDFWMFSFGATTARNYGEHFKLALKGDFRTIGYDFNLNGPGKPWEVVNVLRLNPLMTYAFNQNWSLLGGPIFEFSGEHDADFGDSLRGGANFGVGYTSSGKRFFIALGVVALTEIEDDARIQPLVLINWNIVDSLSLGLKGDTSRGGELRLEYVFANLGMIDALSTGIGFGFRTERFRLNDDNPAGRSEGVGEESATTVKATVGVKFDEHFTLELYGGVTANGEFRLEDDDGDKLIDRGYDNSGFGGANLRFAF